MVTFVYTKNEDVINELERGGEQFIKINDDGTHVYAVSPTSQFKFDNQDETYISNKIRF